MKTSVAFAFLMTAGLLFAQSKEVGNLVIEGVPEIPEELAQRIEQYENTRSATFEDWNADGSAIFALTRFGNTDQVHIVSSPGGYRKQLTFLQSPLVLLMRSLRQQTDSYSAWMKVAASSFNSTGSIPLSENIDCLRTADAPEI